MTKPGGLLYALGAEGTSLVKIGYTTSSIETRVKTLQVGHPFPSENPPGYPGVQAGSERRLPSLLGNSPLACRQFPLLREQHISLA
jgi:hypothetical protein